MTIFPKMTITIKLRLSNRDTRGVKAIHQAILPENDLAPEGITINQKIKENTLFFECNIDFLKNPRLKIESIRRTVDDWIFSLMVALRALDRIVEADNNESKILYYSGERN